MVRLYNGVMARLYKTVIVPLRMYGLPIISSQNIT